MDKRSGSSLRRRRASAPPEVPGLQHLVEMGAKKRRHLYFRDVRSFIAPVFISVVFQSIVYTFFYFRDGVADTASATVVAGGLLLVPVLSALTLGAFRRHRSPIVSAIFVVAVYLSFAVTFVSALRVQISYAGIAAVAPLILLAMAIANVRFHRARLARVAMLAFERDDSVKDAFMAAGAAYVTDPDSEVFSYDTVLIDPDSHHTKHWSNLLAKCYLAGVEVLPWQRFFEIRFGRVHLPSFDVSHLTYSPSQISFARVKRLFDLCAVVLTFPLTAPLAAFTALYIYIRDGGPVLFVQHRRGFAGRVFRVYKFRTMYRGKGGGATDAGDSRIIPGCELIRRARLDELPQFYNVLRGDMSLIGPRPEALDLAKWYSQEIPQWDYRLLVMPGITGWAQVSSGYTSNPDEAKVKLSYDLYYIKYLSFDLDMLILFKTIKTVILGAGAR